MNSSHLPALALFVGNVDERRMVVRIIAQAGNVFLTASCNAIETPSADLILEL